MSRDVLSSMALRTAFVLSLGLISLACQKSPSFQGVSISSSADVVAQAGTDSGNASGFEGRVVYVRMDSLNPCADRDAQGRPRPNGEIDIYEGDFGRSAYLVREHCTELSPPRSIDPSGLSYLSDGAGSLIYQGQTYLPGPVTHPNRLLNTEQFEGSLWGKTGTVALDGAVAAPVSGKLASLLLQDTSTSWHNIGQGDLHGRNNLVYTFSAFLKAATASRGDLSVYEENTSNIFGVGFDLNASTAVASTGGVATVLASGILPIGGGWYRVYVTGLLNPQLSTNLPIGALYLSTCDACTGIFPGDGRSGLYVWGFQLEQENFLSPYIAGSLAP